MIILGSRRVGALSLGLLGFGLRAQGLLGRALGHFIFSFIGLKRILFTNICQKL